MQKSGIFYFTIMVFFLASLTSHSQQPSSSSATDRPLRVEIPAKSTDETYHVIPVNTTGILFYFRSVETAGDTLTKWYFSLYDKNLHSVWVKSIGIRTGLEVKDYYMGNDTLTLIYLAGEKTKGLSGSEMIVRLDCRSGTFKGSRHTVSANLIPVKFRVYKDQAFFGYNLKNEPARIQVVDLESGKATDYPLSSPGVISAVSGFLIDSGSGNLYVTIRKPILKNHIVCYLLKMNRLGTILSETEISTISETWELVNPQLLLVNTDDLLVIATFSVSGRSVKMGSPTGSSGFYTCRIKNGIQSDIRFKNFLELKNFHSLIGEKDMLAIKKKAAKKNRSITDYAPEVNLLIHPLTVLDNQVLFIGESYVPEYHPENFTEFDFYGRPYINTYNVFDGYRYTSAVIAAFDKSGNLKWDNSMEIRNLISPELTPKVNVYCSSSDTMVLCYSSEARIASKIIREDQVVEKLDFSAMDQLYSEDKVLTESRNYMVPWYGPFFLCSGYQEIKNINSTEDRKRLVFYFTKVRFD